MKEITSRANPLLKYVRSLHRHRCRVQEGKCLVEGVRLLEDALEAGAGVEAVFFTAGLLAKERGHRLSRLCQERGCDCYLIPEALLSSVGGTDSPQGVIAVARIPKWDMATLLAGQGPVLVVDRIQDPGNLGTMLRTAEAAGCRGVLLAPGTVDPYNPKVLRATMGAVFRLPLLSVNNLKGALSEVQRAGLQLLAADVQGDIPFWEADFTRPGALVVGNEAWGISEEILNLVDLRVKIPLREGVNSLNAAVAAGIILYEWARQGGMIPGGRQG